LEFDFSSSLLLPFLCYFIIYYYLKFLVPATPEVRGRRIVVQGQPREKHKTLSEKQNKNKRT
jgi:hypothetical protein